MKKFLAAVLAAFFLFSPIHAAEFTDAGNRTILMEGIINFNDETAFVDLYNSKAGTSDSFTHVILKDSPGGSFIDAANIGSNIHLFGLTTETSGFCNSSCAYIWLAGAVLYAHIDDKIGIHAPFYVTTKNGKFENSAALDDPEIAEANAAAAIMAGWYLGSIGISASTTARFIETKQPDLTQINFFDVPIVFLEDGKHGR